DVNRAEAAKFLLLARYGTVADVPNNGNFPDVLDGQWYTKYVVIAADKGIISGHPDGTFRPADTVNTAEFLKMLSLTFALQLNLSHSFSDVLSQDWFASYAGIAEKYDLFPGRSAYLNPGDPLTREEVAVTIYQYLQNR
ncbi:S-layer homology domain-containing protein, partial [Candidatus Peribacteria bacterium]|nr:S-layer homology domain-containing protein [Candidatus Peribacteria bacterium]